MSKYLVEDTSLISVADAIREKSGESGGLIFPDGFVDGIVGIDAKIVSKTFTVTEISGDIVSMTFEHNFGRVPKLFCVVPDFSKSEISSTAYSYVLLSTSTNSFLARHNNFYVNLSDYFLSQNKPSSAYCGIFADETKIVWKTYFDSVFTVTVGDTYRYFIVG